MKFKSILPFCCLLFAAGTLPAQPKRVLIIGDSMMQVPAHATSLALEKKEGVVSKAQTSLGSGLARLDAYDWVVKVDELVKEFQPDTSLVWFGTNDRQPMMSDNGTLRPEDPAWETEYARRVGLIMDKLSTVKGSKVYWLELPVMREAKMTAEVDMINRIAKAEADKRESVVFLPVRQVLSRKPEVFSAYLIGRDARPVQVRAPDGVHLTRPGADLIAEHFLKQIYP